MIQISSGRDRLACTAARAAAQTGSPVNLQPPPPTEDDVSAVQPCGGCDVRAHSFCSALRAVELERLADMAERLSLKAGEALLRREERAAHVFNITGGLLRVSRRLDDGRRQVVGFLGKGDFLGFGATGTYGFDAEAVTAASVCRFDRLRFAALMEASPTMERRLLCMASDEIREGQEQQLLLGRRTAEERIACFLLNIAKRQRRLGAGEGTVTLPMGRADIADHLGLTPETVSRTLTSLKVEGVIRLEPAAAVRLLQPRQLEALAAGHG